MIFSEYMEAWLYGPRGYYRTLRPIGKEGDFYTAVSTSPFFGAAVANHLYRLIAQGEVPREAALVEIGAHQGYWIADMIQWLYTCDPALLQSMRFIIVERHEEVRAAQQRYFVERFGDAVVLEHVTDLDQLSLSYAFVVANEILDAFPCDLYIQGKAAYVEGEAILWREASGAMQEHAHRYGMDKGEIAVGYDAFATRLYRAAERLDFVTFDYGDRHVRNDFSIRIYQGHEVYPFFDDSVEMGRLFGTSDLTFDVHFGAVMDAFEAAGFDTVAFEKQSRALIRFGLIDLLEQYAQTATQADYLHHADKIKTLIDPGAMGERFKMVHFRKGPGTA